MIQYQRNKIPSYIVNSISKSILEIVAYNVHIACVVTLNTLQKLETGDQI